VRARFARVLVAPYFWILVASAAGRPLRLNLPQVGPRGSRRVGRIACCSLRVVISCSRSGVFLCGFGSALIRGSVLLVSTIARILRVCIPRLLGSSVISLFGGSLPAVARRALGPASSPCFPAIHGRLADSRFQFGFVGVRAARPTLGPANKSPALAFARAVIGLLAAPKSRAVRLRLRSGPDLPPRFRAGFLLLR